MSSCSRRRLTYLTQWFAPEPTAVPVWIAEALVRQGWDLTVVTGIPNYPDGVVKDGYRAWRPARDRHGHIKLVRAPLYPSHDASALGRVANYTSWAISSMIVGRRALRESDAVLVYSSPATAALAALWARLRHGRPFVLLIPDLWPDSIFAAGFLDRPVVRRVVEPVVDRFVRWSYKHASAIAVIAPGMRQTLIDRGVSAHKIEVVFNWADESIFHPADASGRLRAMLDVPSGTPMFLYGGNIGAAQGLEPVVDAFRDLAGEAHLVLVGDGIRKTQLQTRARGASNIHFHDPVPVEEMTGLQADADVLVVSLTDDPLFEITLPSKTQAYLASGRTLLAVARGDAARVVAAAGAGATASPGDVADIVRAVRELAELTSSERAACGARSYDFYSTEMSEAVGAARLSALLDSVAESSPRRQERR